MFLVFDPKFIYLKSKILFHWCYVLYYSYLNASTGLSFEARYAGIAPNIIPIKTENNKAKANKLKLIKVLSSPPVIPGPSMLNAGKKRCQWGKNT